MEGEAGKKCARKSQVRRKDSVRETDCDVSMIVTDTWFHSYPIHVEYNLSCGADIYSNSKMKS